MTTCLPCILTLSSNSFLVFVGASCVGPVDNDVVVPSQRRRVQAQLQALRHSQVLQPQGSRLSQG